MTPVARLSTETQPQDQLQEGFMSEDNFFTALGPNELYGYGFATSALRSCLADY
jgi:hypothetical protein